MPRIVVTHAVVDIDRWLKGKARRAAAMEEHGVVPPINAYIQAN